LKKPVEDLFSASGDYLTNGGGLKELEQIQNFVSGCNIIVHDGLSHDRVIFERNSLSNKKLHLLYNADSGHINVITYLKTATTNKYISNGCDTLYGNSQKCQKAGFFCTTIPPSFKDQSHYFGS